MTGKYRHNPFRYTDQPADIRLYNPEPFGKSFMYVLAAGQMGDLGPSWYHLVTEDGARETGEAFLAEDEKGAFPMSDDTLRREILDMLETSGASPYLTLTAKPCRLSLGHRSKRGKNRLC